jgi:LmbE family N-acetylglucosaminyl deacetylase
MTVHPAKLTARKILVIAPHPDDESLGCGGLINTLAGQGRSFHIVFVTDGGASHTGSHKWSRQRLATRREQEAANALRHLGIGDQPRTFLRLRDAAMPSIFSVERRSAVAEMNSIIRSFRPDLILMPWRRDSHCDHRDSWRLVMDSMPLGPTKPATLEYAIWLEELGRIEDYPRADEAEPVTFNVTSALRNKRAAIAAHLSQTTDLIDDDPGAFRLTSKTIARLTDTFETYWRPLDETH